MSSAAMDPGAAGWSAYAGVLTAGVLVAFRLGGVVLTAPLFSSAAIPARVKAMFVVSVASLMAAPCAQIAPGRLALSPATVLGEVVLGLAFGLVLAFLLEAVHFAATVMSFSFSFSLANLLDPNSLVETDVLGTALNWMLLLILLAAGLHRVLLAALLHTFLLMPPGTAVLGEHSVQQVVFAFGGVFLAGAQLASPVVAATLLVEVALGLVSRAAPMLPAQVLGVPLKAATAYVVLTGTLALWPAWVTHRFELLLTMAERLVRS